MNKCVASLLLLALSTACGGVADGEVSNGQPFDPTVLFTLGYGVGGGGTGNPCGVGFEGFTKQEGYEGPPVLFCVSGSEDPHECASKFVRELLDSGEFGREHFESTICQNLDLLAGYTVQVQDEPNNDQAKCTVITNAKKACEFHSKEFNEKP